MYKTRIFETLKTFMKKILLLILFSFLQITVFGQDAINFEFSFPENSRFTIEQKVDNSGTMKITGTKVEMENLKKSGYNADRKLKYLMNYSSEYTTGERTSDNFSFEFFYSNVSFDIDSDGKKQNREWAFPSVILKAGIINGKLAVIQSAKTGSSSQDQFINSLPRYFTTDFPKINNLKIGESFIVKRIANNQTEGYSFSGNLKYTLKKIENELAYFSISVIVKNYPESTLNSSGNGTGEMIYNHKDKFIQSEKIKINLSSSQNKTVNITATNVIISTYELKNLVRN
ncbi:hypothetical protein SAMN05421856_106145 [Chryseobacterium taichungense]|uniref:Uncharacterized protein n=2 Tax=Chryseobacterium taichungense TaxID=295069 RepID=A0A1H8AY54_9FLAO|nr:hypothetical protein SAMN05421856_106145 [Chryseobacterium taichungense]